MTSPSQSSRLLRRSRCARSYPESKDSSPSPGRSNQTHSEPQFSARIACVVLQVHSPIKCLSSSPLNHADAGLASPNIAMGPLDPNERRLPWNRKPRIRRPPAPARFASWPAPRRPRGRPDMCHAFRGALRRQCTHLGRQMPKALYAGCAPRGAPRAPATDGLPICDPKPRAPLSARA